MFEFMQHDTALEYLDIFMKYLANTDNKVTKEDAVKAIETVLPERGAEMIKGWAKEFVEEGKQEGRKNPEPCWWKLSNRNLITYVMI